MNILKKIILLLIVSVLILSLFIFLRGEKRTSNEIVIGALLALTGDEAKYGQWAKEAIEIAVEEINSAGGIEDKTFRVIYEDSTSTNNGAISAFRKLIDVHRVQVIIGPTRSGSTLACAPIANEKKIVLITPTAGSPKIAEAGDFIFRTRESGELQARVLANYIFTKLNVNRLCILYPQESNAIGYKEALSGEFRKLGGNIVAVESFPEDKDDLKTEIQKLADNDTQAIYIPGTAVHIGRALKQCYELGIKVKFFSSVGAENPEIIQIAGNAADGLIYSGMVFEADSKENYTASFVKKYSSKYGRIPNAWAANAYDTTKIIADILKSGVTGGEEIRDKLYNIKNYTGVSGTISFDRRGEAIKSVAIKTIIKNEFRIMEIMK